MATVASGGRVQLQDHAQLARQAWPALPRGTGVGAGELVAVGLDRLQGEALFVEHFVHGVVYRLVQLVGKGFADQLMGDQVGNRHVQGDQRLAEVLDVQVVDFFYQAMGQVGFIQQASEADVAVHDFQGLEEELLGDLQYRLDLRLDASLARHAIGGVQQVGHLVDIGGDKTGHRAFGVGLRQLDGRVQVR